MNDFIGNQRMAAALKRGEALDVSKFAVPGCEHYELPPGFYRDGVDYCDANLEAWIWSIGRDVRTNKIYAARDGRFYQHPAYECLWLR